MSSKDLGSVWGDCVTYNICIPGIDDGSFYGGTIIVRNTGTRTQQLRFTLEMYYRPNGTVGCTMNVDKNLGDQQIDNGDFTDIPGKDVTVPAFVKPGRTVKVSVSDDSAGCLSADDNLVWTPRIKPIMDDSE